MTQPPSFPRSRRTLDDLDALIDASIGKSEGDQAITPSPASKAPPVPSPDALATPPERFRITIDPAVIVATKLAALQRKVAPSEIVEKALKRFLGLEES